MPSLVATLASYTPAHIVSSAPAAGTATPKPTRETFEGAVLFADISGFTALTERLAARGIAGSEDLTRLLNGYLGQLVDEVLDAGGDIVKFAGDALLAIWPARPDLGPAVHRAAACAARVQARLHNQSVAPDVTLSLKLAIGAGPITCFTLGGIFGRFEFVVTGGPLRQCGLGNDLARPGQVVVSGEAWSLLQGHASAAPLEGGAVLLQSVSPPAATRTANPATLTPASTAAPLLRAFIPAAIRSRLDAGQSDWLGELRRVSVIFLNLPGLTHETTLERAQEIMTTLQQNLYRFEGSINKISVDDKGASLVAALGLPPLAHEDDPDRASLAALAMQGALARLGVESAAGVTTGVAFCGTVGSERRREYTLMGDVVNLAARLMQHARTSALPVIADAATRTAAGDRIDFVSLPEVRVKGKAGAITIARPTGLREIAADSAGEEAGPPAAPIVERDRERALLRERLSALAENGTGSWIHFEGDAGIGKSALIADGATKARAAGVRALVGGGDSVESSTPYFAWRRPLAALFGITGAAKTSAPTLVLGRLPADERVLAHAPLLGPVLGIPWEDNELTAPLAGQARANATGALVARVLAVAAMARPLAIVLEDLHWFDGGSHALLRAVAEQVKNAVLITTSRPVPAPVPPDYAATLAAPGIENHPLGRMSEGAVLTLAARRIGAGALPPAIADLIRTRADGNPFFAEELALAMRDRALVEVAAGVCTVAPGAGDPAGWAIPTTVQGVILSRIDRLAPQQQLTLKVASVVGHVFRFRTLLEVHPVGADAAVVGHELKMLDGLDLTPLERPEPDLAYVFKHITTQEVAYELLPFEQRRTLHRAVAEWFEQTHAGELFRFYPLLAHHWTRAVDDRTPDEGTLRKAVDYHRLAGDQAARAFMNAEAIRAYEAALGEVGRLPPGSARDRLELSIALPLGAVLIATRGYGAPAVLQTYARARALCEHLGDDALLFTALRGLWAFHIGRAEFHTARGLAEQLLGLALKGPDQRLLLEAHRTLGNTAFWLGELDAAREHMQSGIETYHPLLHTGLAFEYGQDPDVANRGMQGWPLALMGKHDEALARGQEALARGRELNHPYSLGYALVHDTCVKQYLGMVEEADAGADATMALAGEKNFPNWLLAGMAVKGWAMARKGQPGPGAEQVKMVVGLWRGVGSELCVPYFLTMQA
ncbi:MAG: AAA family ATPase, partial [Phycisphaerales bacterium]